MPTRNVSITDHQDRFVGEVLASGRYQNASEVVREGLRLLERREATEAAKLARLRAVVAEADAEIARGAYIEVDDDKLSDWLDRLGTTGRDARTE